MTYRATIHVAKKQPGQQVANTKKELAHASSKGHTQPHSIGYNYGQGRSQIKQQRLLTHTTYLAQTMQTQIEAWGHT